MKSATRPRHRLLATVAAATLLTLSACGSSASDESGGGGDSGAAEPAAASAQDGVPIRESGGRTERAAEAADLDAQLADTSFAAFEAGKPEAPAEVTSDRSVISTGNVALRSKDVAQGLFDVRKVVDEVAGEVEQEKTETDEKGEVLRSRLVLRVPAARFADAMEGLESAADLVSSGSDSKDVTTKVLDVEVRVRVQRRSIERIALLLDRAESIRDIVAIEAQLSRRQADLASLEKQQSFLADQTSMSTITVSLERTPKKPTPPAPPEEDEAGFLTGLEAGWSALTTFGVGLATFAGAVLPWTLVLLLVGVPGWPLLRRLRRRADVAPST